MVKALKLPCHLPQLLTSRKCHHVDLPNQYVGDGLLHLAELCLNLPFDAPAILHIGKNKRLDIAVGEDLGGPRTECAICTGDQDGFASVRFCGDGGPAKALGA